MIGLKTVGFIIISGYIDDAELSVAGRWFTIDRLSHRARRIKRTYSVGQHFSGGYALRAALLWDFVADTPHYNAGVIAAAKHHAVDISLPLSGKETGIVLRPFGAVPCIKGLIDDDHAQFIGGLQGCPAGR